MALNVKFRVIFPFIKSFFDIQKSMIGICPYDFEVREGHSCVTGQHVFSDSGGALSLYKLPVRGVRPWRSEET